MQWPFEGPAEIVGVSTPRGRGRGRGGIIECRLLGRLENGLEAAIKRNLIALSI